MEEKFELVVAGHGIAVVPISVAASYSRPDLVYRPLSDAVPLETCLVVMADRQDQRVADFLTVAAETLSESRPDSPPSTNLSPFPMGRSNRDARLASLCRTVAPRPGVLGDHKHRRSVNLWGQSATPHCSEAS